MTKKSPQLNAALLRMRKLYAAFLPREIAIAGIIGDVGTLLPHYKTGWTGISLSVEYIMAFPFATASPVV